MIILSLVIMFSNGIGVSIYWLQFFYYFFATFMFLIAFGILNSTVSMLVRDYHLLLQAVFRILFYFSGTIVDIRGLKDIGGGGDALLKILELNPMYYLTSGMRDSFIGGTWFYEKPTLSIMFWLVVFLILLFGSHLHLKFRSRFVDFL
jgi:teichoic acid transport system permease protein